MHFKLMSYKNQINSGLITQFLHFFNPLYSYKGISSGESGYQKGPDDLDEEKDHKVDMQDGMQDDGMDMMHSNEQAIPLATAGDV